jgi:hypothetical protein
MVNGRCGLRAEEELITGLEAINYGEPQPRVISDCDIGTSEVMIT